MEKLMELKWGSFSSTHIITLCLSAVIIIGIYFILKNKSDKTRRIVLFILSLAGPAAVLYNILMWGLKSTVLEYLPLHLCSINAMLLPFLAGSKNNFLGNLLPFYSVGALAALIFNTFQADFLIFDHVFAMYYFPHTLEFGIPIIMIALGMVEIRPKYILPCLGVTFVIYTAVHFANLGLNEYLRTAQILDSAGNVIEVNYMYSLAPMGNPALEFFWSIVPHEYFYMLVALLIIGVVYLLMNIKHVIAFVKRKRA